MKKCALVTVCLQRKVTEGYCDSDYDFGFGCSFHCESYPGHCFRCFCFVAKMA